MVVAFDTGVLQARFRNTGIYFYALNLLRQFRCLTSQDPSLSLTFFTGPNGQNDAGQLAPAERFQPVSTRLLRHDVLWRLGVGALMVGRKPADVVFAPAPTLPLSRVPVVVAIHDAMVARMPTSFIPKKKIVRHHVWAAARLATTIVTDSKHSRQELIETYNLNPDKVRVVHLGYNRELYNDVPNAPEEESRLLSRLGIRCPYIIHVGMIWRRKNLTRLVEAFKMLVERQRDIQLELVLAGPLGSRHEETVQAAGQVKLPARVHFTGPLPDRELATLVKGATLSVIPSLYEGFCLPMVEAMACGVPTISSNTSCLPEISGNKLMYFDPSSSEEIATRMQQVLEDADLRDRLARDGLERAQEFSWELCARQLLVALREAC